MDDKAAIATFHFIRSDVLCSSSPSDSPNEFPHAVAPPQQVILSVDFVCGLPPRCCRIAHASGLSPSRSRFLLTFFQGDLGRTPVSVRSLKLLNHGDVSPRSRIKRSPLSLRSVRHVGGPHRVLDELTQTSQAVQVFLRRHKFLCFTPTFVPCAN